MRILGLDFGDKTIGVAVSDPFGWTAQGVEIIRRESSMEFKKCMRRLAELVEQYQAVRLADIAAEVNLSVSYFSNLFGDASL